MARLSIGPRAAREDVGISPTSLTQRISQGAFWTVTAGAANKVVTLAGQLVLAWLLMPEDFGLAALATSFASIATLFSAANLKTILIQRRERFEELAADVHWLGLTLHVLAGAVIFSLAPIASIWFGELRVVSLIRIIAVSLPLTALSTIYWARLQADLRFETVTAIQFGQGVIQTVSTIALALFGFGPFSFVLPRLWVPVCGLLAARWRSGPIPVKEVSFRRWRSLIATSVWISAYALMHSLTGHATNFVLGLIETAAVVGIFFWGSQVAAQAVYLLSANLLQVFFPAFAVLKTERGKMAAAFRDSVSVGTTVAALLCVLQFLLAKPVIDALFADRWQEAIAVVRLLSLGLVFFPMSVAGASVFLGLGEFRALVRLAALQLVLITGSAAVGGLWGGPALIAACVAAATVLGHLAMGLVATKRMRLPSRGFLRATAAPIAVAICCGSLGAAVFRLMEWSDTAIQASSTAAAIVAGWVILAPIVSPPLGRLVRSSFGWIGPANPSCS